MLFSVASIMGGMIFMMVRSCRQLEGQRDVSNQSRASVAAPGRESDFGTDRGGLASV
jgi:hypothetical protein